MPTHKAQHHSSRTTWGLVKASLATIALVTAFSANPVMAATTQVKCGSGKNTTRTCKAKVGKIKGVILRQQRSRETCVIGQNWGQSKKGVWTKNGCKGTFDIYHGKLTKAERKKLRVAAGNRVAQPVVSHNPSNNGRNDDIGKGLVVIGGLLVGAAILNEIFDDDNSTTTYTTQPTPQPAPRPTPRPNPYYNNGHQWDNGSWNNDNWGNNNGWNNGPWISDPNYGQAQNKKRNRKKAINVCSSVAVNDAIANGYLNAQVSSINSVTKTGRNRWKISGTIKQQYRHQVVARRSGHWRNWNSFGDWRRGIRGQNKPRYVIQEENRSFSCVVKNGQVRGFNKW